MVKTIAPEEPVDGGVSAEQVLALFQCCTQVELGLRRLTDRQEYIAAVKVAGSQAAMELDDRWVFVS